MSLATIPDAAETLPGLLPPDCTHDDCEPMNEPTTSVIVQVFVHSPDRTRNTQRSARVDVSQPLGPTIERLTREAIAELEPCPKPAPTR